MNARVPDDRIMKRCEDHLAGWAQVKRLEMSGDLNNTSEVSTDRRLYTPLGFFRAYGYDLCAGGVT